MLNLPSKVLLSREYRIASSEAIVVYFVLRCDASESYTATSKLAKQDNRLSCGWDVQMIAQKTGLVEYTIQRAIAELVKRRWVEKGLKHEIILGKICNYECKWFLESLVALENVQEIKSSTSTLEILRGKLEEDRAYLTKARLSKAAKKKLVSDTFGKSFSRGSDIKSKDILVHFLRRYELKYGEKCPMIEEGSKGNPFSTTYVYIGRAVKWAGSPEKVMEVVDFLFDKWEDLKKGTGLEGRPTFNIIGSSRLWTLLRECMIEGIPEKRDRASKVVKRYNDKRAEEEKDLGW